MQEECLALSNRSNFLCKGNGSNVRFEKLQISNVSNYTNKCAHISCFIIHIIMKAETLLLKIAWLENDTLCSMTM